MSDINKRRDEILKLCEENVLAADKQKIKSGKYDDMEIALVEWIRDKVCNGIPINGPIVMTKAEEYAIRFNYSDFKPNPGWLERFKNRFSIKFTTKHGESGSVDQTVVTNWKRNLSNLVADYSASDIFNADETGLFFKLLPNKTLSFKDQTCVTGKKAKSDLQFYSLATLMVPKS